MAPFPSVERAEPRAPRRMTAGFAATLLRPAGNLVHGVVTDRMQ